MYILIAVVFVLGYAFIALEHPLKIDKAASALLTAVICWALLSFGKESMLHDGALESGEILETGLMHHLGEISGILFFLLGAMTIVELVDVHGGFTIITQQISTTSKGKLVILLSVITFFMSAVLDNLTTAIVMSTLLRKIIGNKNDLWLFAGMVIISANAGGAWSPIGDVTTIMLWIGGNVTAGNIVLKLFVPSLICMAVPALVLAYRLKGKVETPDKSSLYAGQLELPLSERRLVLALGLGALLFVPIFKYITHLPPFLGILFGLGVVWVSTELMHRRKDHNQKKSLSISAVLQRVDTPSILFFLGILLAVAALQTAGHLVDLAELMNQKIGNIWIINLVIGFLSSVVDNVPLVAGAMGMYDLNIYSQDHLFWELLAYCAGTGGSCLIIGSAAGVASMGILGTDFIWYLKKVTPLAVLGYLSGAGVFWLMNSFF